MSSPLPPVPPSTPILVRACSLRPWHSEDVGGNRVGWVGDTDRTEILSLPIPFFLWVFGWLLPQQPLELCLDLDRGTEGSTVGTAPPPEPTLQGEGQAGIYL